MSQESPPLPVPTVGPTSEPARPRVWPSLMAFAFLVVGVVIGSGLLFGIWATVELAREGALSNRDPAALQEALDAKTKALMWRPGIWVASGFLNAFLQLALALVPARLSGGPWRERVRLVPSARFPAVAWIATGLGVLMLGYVCTAVVHLAGWWKADGPLALVERVARTASPGEFGLLLLALALGAGVCEELFFRGYLQTRLVARWGRWVGIGVASLAFGFVHFDWVHSTYAFAVGLLLGWAADRAGSIRPTIVVHVLNNALSLWVSRETQGRWPDSWYLTSLGVSLALLLACVFVLRRVTRKKPAPVEAAVQASSPA